MCVNGDVELFWLPFRSHRRTSTGLALFPLRSHVACTITGLVRFGEPYPVQLAKDAALLELREKVRNMEEKVGRAI